MTAMFFKAPKFNGLLTNNGRFPRVTSMWLMFTGAEAFNQDVSNWFVGLVDNMEAMFQDATSFNQDISGWDFGVRPVNIDSMFFNAQSFNQDLCAWREKLRNAGNDGYYFEVFRRTNCEDEGRWGDVDFSLGLPATMCHPC